MRQRVQTVGCDEIEVTTYIPTVPPRTFFTVWLPNSHPGVLDRIFAVVGRRKHDVCVLAFSIDCDDEQDWTFLTL